MFLCSYSPYPYNSKPLSTVYKLVLFVSCIDHRMFVYILCTPTKCRICTTPPPIPPSYLHPADLKQMGPPLCAVVLLKVPSRSEEHTSALQSHLNLVCRLLLEKKREH